MAIRRYLAVLILLLAGYVLPAHAQRGDAINCSSRDYGYNECNSPARHPVLLRQTSDSACIEGRSWGVTRRGNVWVDKGCGGTFGDARGGGGGGGGHHGDHDRGGGGWRPGPGWDTDLVLECGSDDYQYRFCQVDVGRGGSVRVGRQLSETRCVEGRNWGWNRAGVWVNGGCAARFAIDRRWE
jgi:hypothetical protein